MRKPTVKKETATLKDDAIKEQDRQPLQLCLCDDWLEDDDDFAEFVIDYLEECRQKCLRMERESRRGY